MATMRYEALGTVSRESKHTDVPVLVLAARCGEDAGSISPEWQSGIELIYSDSVMI